MEFYSLNEIKELFKSYSPSLECPITEEEHEQFCEAIKQLPKEIVDIVNKEIYFILMSSNPSSLNAACYIDIERGIPKEKKGIVIVTPIIFGYKPGLFSPGIEYILHEIAHHILGHYKYDSQTDIIEKEKTATNLASKWIAESFLRNNN